MSTPAERLLRALEKENRLDNRAEVARAAGIKPVTFNAYYRGERRPPLDICIKIANVLNVNADWLFNGSGEMDRVNFSKPNASQSRHIQPKVAKLIPLFGTALAGPDGSFDLSAPAFKRIEAPAALGDANDAYAVFVVGDSMEPRYEAGETVYIHPHKPIKPKDYVFVQVFKGQPDNHTLGYVKRLVSITDESVVCEQLNPKKQITFPRNRVKSIHKIVLGGESS